MSNKVFVTGAGGAIGFWLTKELLYRGNHVTIVDRFIHKNKDEAFNELIKTDGLDYHKLDLCDYDSLKKIECDFDYIYHLAAYNGTQNFYNNPFNVLVNSTIPTINVLKWASESEKKPKFIYSSSSEAYAGAITHYDGKVPTSENIHLVIDDPKNVRWSYGGSKLHGELACFAAFSQFNIPCTVLRYHNVFGERMGLNHVIPDFISRALDGIYELYGSEDTRSFIYVKDAVDATIAVAESDSSSGEIINIGSDEEIKIIDLAEMILKIMGINSDIQIFDSPKGSVSRRCPDITKLKLIHPEVIKTPLNKGLQEIILDISKRK
tara:strand:- start:1486 stop:2451 length:966 start_codon:yes stop_codon:yes gene_type:complete